MGRIQTGRYEYVRIWNASTGRLIREIELPFGHEAASLAWSPDGTVLASGDLLQVTRVFAKGDLVGTLHGHTQAVVSSDWSRVSNRIISGSRDGTVRVWGIRLTRMKKSLPNELWQALFLFQSPQPF